MRVLKVTSKLALLISFAYSWTTESGDVKTKPCQGLWLICLDKCLALIEKPVPSQPARGTLQQASGIHSPTPTPRPHVR